MSNWGYTTKSGRPRNMDGTMNKWYEENTPHSPVRIDERGFKRNVVFTSELIREGPVFDQGWIDSEDCMFYDGAVREGKEVSWDRPEYALAGAVLADGLNTASMDANEVKTPYYHQKRVEEIAEAKEWIFSDNEEDDMVCLHTFNSCCRHLNLEPDEVRREWKEQGGIRISPNNLFERAA